MLSAMASLATVLTVMKVLLSLDRVFSSPKIHSLKLVVRMVVDKTDANLKVIGIRFQGSGFRDIYLLTNLLGFTKVPFPHENCERDFNILIKLFEIKF